MRVSPDEMTRIIRGGLDRIESPKAALSFVKTEVRGLGLKPDTGDAKADAIIRLILKVVEK